MTIYTTSLAAQVSITTVFSVLVLVGVIGNTLSCLVIILNRSMRTPMNYLILNLALADIMVTLFIAPRFIFIHSFDHPRGLTGSIICKFFTGGNFSWMGGSASVFSLVAISVERYFAVVHPYKTRGKLTTKKLHYVILACWVVAIVFNLPLFFIINYNEKIDFCTEYWPEEWMAKAYSSSWLVLFGVIPIALMTALYVRVIRRLWIKPQDGPRVTQAAVLKSRKRVTKMVIMVSAVYAITWFPVLIIYMLNYYYKDQHYGNVTYVIAIVIVTFNSCVNPFVYAFCNGRFRSHLKKLFAFTCLKANQIRLEREKRDQTAMATTDSSNSQKRRQEFEMQI
ncbi:allatostatin-A receptor-like [Acropora palmata]|uniref:allatostatin-A receptor-like n=1 Tax=Acropora palmata TaxID=6131 RepID=UPI003D9FC2F1